MNLHSSECHDFFLLERVQSCIYNDFFQSLSHFYDIPLNSIVSHIGRAPLFSIP